MKTAEGTLETLPRAVLVVVVLVLVAVAVALVKAVLVVDVATVVLY